MPAIFSSLSWARGAALVLFGLCASALGQPNPAAIQSVPQVVRSAHAKALLRLNAMPLNGLPTPQDFGATGDGRTDDGPALRKALAAGRGLRLGAGTYLVAPDPASAFIDGGVQRYAWSLRIPSGAYIVVEPGAEIRQAPGAQAWTRTVSFQDAIDVTVLGTMAVDANVQQIGAQSNEHMHGVFFYNTRSTYVEGIESRNARGDNVFIGGSGESQFSRDVIVGRIVAETAGRKNLVLHYAETTVGAASLDNRRGGAALYGGRPDTTDRHSLDVEPDGYTGLRSFLQRLGRVVTRGSGNDFSAGTSPRQGDGFVVQIDELHSTISGSSTTVPAWEQNAITIDCRKLSITGMNALDAPVRLAYAARLRAETVSLSGASATPDGFLVQIVTSGGPNETPRVDIQDLSVANSRGHGLDIRTAALRLSSLSVQAHGLAVRFAENTASKSEVKPIRIDKLVTRDTGQDAVVAVSTFSGAAPDIVIGEFAATDARDKKVARLFRVDDGLAKSFKVQRLINPDAIRP